MRAHNLRGIVFVFATSMGGGGCTKPSTPANARTVVSAPASPSAHPSENCQGFGVVPCNVAAASSEDLCARISGCIEQHGDSGDRKPIFVYDCQKLEALETSADVGELAVLRVQADQERRFVETEKYERHPNAGEATFLVGRHAGGYCLIDQVMDWDWDTMGEISEQYATRMQRANGRPEVLIQIERASRMELDQEEREQGEDDLRYARCASRGYLLDGARFTRSKSEETSELCSSLPVEH